MSKKSVGLSVIDPIFEEQNSVTLVFSFDENYCKFFSVALESLVKNSRSNLKYDLVILTSQTNQQYQERLYRQIPSNFSLRFVELPKIIARNFYEINLKKNERWAIDAYFRCFIPLILRNYKRVLYLDCDLVVEGDLQELYNQEFENKKLIAINDTTPNLYRLGMDKEREEYERNVLKLNDTTKYFNSGVLLFNIEAIEPNEYLNLLKEGFELDFLMFADQAVLNMIFKDEVKLVSSEWNYCCGELIFHENFLDLVEGEYKKEFLNAKTNPKIIHYTSWLKPWNYPLREHFEKFWYYARRCPFYEDILLETNKRKEQ